MILGETHVIENRAVSSSIAIILFLLFTVIISITLYYWVIETSSKFSTESTPKGIKTMLKWEAIEKLPSGGLRIYVRNIGTTPIHVDKIYLVDPNKGIVIYDISYDLELKKGELNYVYLPVIYLAKLDHAGYKKIKVVLGTTSGANTISQVSSKVIEVSYKPTFLALKAYRYSSLKTHWVIFDYNTGDYKFYDETYSNLQGPYTGTAPILQDVNEYTITTSWVSWNNRPLDSPILIVVNPKRGSENWVFTWHDPHGTFKFYVQSLEGEIEIDFLVFWEDLFNPYNPPSSVDDWKDHVLRVTVFTNGTYRIAVYMAKGGYSHEFYLDINDDINLGTPVYTKPYGAYWINSVGGYLREIPDKIWLVTP